MKTNLVATIFAFDRTRWHPAAASRCAAGMVLPLAAAIATHHPEAGILGCLGALYAGVASFGGVSQTRLKTMLGSAVVTACATFFGILLGKSDPAAAVATLLCSFGFALFGGSSPAASIIGLQGSAVLVVFLGLGLPPSTALANASIVLGGALGQTVLLTLIWRPDPAQSGRIAIAAAIDSLAAFVRNTHDAFGHETWDGPRIPGSEPFQEARNLLEQSDSRESAADHALLLLLMQRAEPIRAALVGWSRASEAYRHQGPEANLRVVRKARSLERRLRLLAMRTKRHWIPAPAESHPHAHPVEKGDAKSEFRHWIVTVDRLIHCFESTQAFDVPIAIKPAEPAVGLRDRLFKFVSALTKLPNVASLRSVSMRHALRYACTLTAAVIVSRMTGLWHAYWFPLTIALILRADFAMTFTRGAARLIGTVMGAAVATLLLHILHPNLTVEVCAMLVSAWFAFAAFQASYLIYSSGITLYVVFSVAASAVAPERIGLTRMAATLLGVLVAVTAYILWPAIHWQDFWQVMRDAIQAQIGFDEAVRSGDAAKIDIARQKARGLRIQCETLLRSANLDPLARRSKTFAEATAAVERLHESGAEMLALEASQSAAFSNWDETFDTTLNSAKTLLNEVQARIA